LQLWLAQIEGNEMNSSVSAGPTSPRSWQTDFLWIVNFSRSVPNRRKVLLLSTFCSGGKSPMTRSVFACNYCNRQRSACFRPIQDQPWHEEWWLTRLVRSSALPGICAVSAVPTPERSLGHGVLRTRSTSTIPLKPSHTVRSLMDTATTERYSPRAASYRQRLACDHYYCVVTE